MSVSSPDAPDATRTTAVAGTVHDPSPFELVTLLQTVDHVARKVLERWCRVPMTRLVTAISARSGNAQDETDVLTARALRWVEMYLRSRRPEDYKGMRRETFVASLLLAAYRGLDVSPGAISTTGPSRNPAPPVDAYEIWSYSAPLEDVGGDWWDHDGGPEQPLWLIVGDVTGHGYPAYLVAAGLPYLWRSRSIAELRARAREPRDLLAALGSALERVLPDEVFVEAVVARFAPSGEVALSAAGGGHPVLRRSGAGRAEFHTLRGCFLGLEIAERDQSLWSLDPGDEVLLASDGLFDQPCGEDVRLTARLPECAAARLASGRDLHDAVIDVLRDALGTCPQHDDVTVITLRRRAGPRGLGAGHAAV